MNTDLTITAHKASDGWWIAEGRDAYGIRHIRASKFNRVSAIARVKRAQANAVRHRV